MGFGIPLDWLVRAELDPTSDGNFSLASQDQADAGGDCLVGRDAGHGDRVPRGGERETWRESEDTSGRQPAVKAASLAMLDVRTSC